MDGFEFTVLQRNLEEWHKRPWTYVLLMLKESNNRRFDSYRVRNNVLIISHITFGDCREHIFSVNLSRNSCVDMLARPAGSTLSRRENQSMRERCWLGQRGQLYSHINAG